MVHYLYPVDWAELAFEIKALNGWTCQNCGRLCQRPGEPFRGNDYLLTVAHYYHEYDTPTAFVAVLCTPCHFIHDAPYVWRSRRRVDRIRRLAAGQLELTI